MPLPAPVEEEEPSIYALPAVVVSEPVVPTTTTTAVAIAATVAPIAIRLTGAAAARDLARAGAARPAIDAVDDRATKRRRV